MARRSEYRDKITNLFDDKVKDVIDDIESDVNDAISELESISEDLSKSDILEHVDSALTVLLELSEKLY